MDYTAQTLSVKEEEEKKMKKRFWGFAAAVALAAGLGFLWSGLLADGDTQSETEGETGGQAAEILLEEDTEQLFSVTVEGNSGDFYAEKDAQNQMKIPSLEGLPTDQEKIDELCKYACLLRGQERVTTAKDNLKEYGLNEEDAVHVEIVFENGKTEELWIGALAQGVSNDSRYVLYGDQIYTMYELHLKPFLNEKEYFISGELTPGNENADYILLYLSVKNSDEEKPLTVSYQEARETTNGQYMAAYHIISPEEYEISYNEEGTQFLQSVFGMEAEPVKAWPSQEELSVYGLEDPQKIVQAAYMSREGEDYGIQFSVSEADEEGYVYLMVDGLDVVYRYQTEDAAWYHATMEEIVGRQILVPNITDVAAVTLQTSEEAFTVQLETDAEGELQATLNGEFCSIDEFKKLYQIIISAEVDSLCSEAKEQQALLIRIEYEYHDGSKDEISFFEGPARQAYVLLNGQVYGMIRESYVNTILESLTLFKNGETIPV